MLLNAPLRDNLGFHKTLYIKLNEAKSRFYFWHFILFSIL